MLWDPECLRWDASIAGVVPRRGCQGYFRDPAGQEPKASQTWRPERPQRNIALTIRTKLLALSLTLVGTLGTLFVIIASDFYRLADLPAQAQAVRMKVRSGLNDLSDAAALLLAHNDPFALDRLQPAYAIDPDFLWLVIWDDDGRVVYGQGVAPDQRRVLYDVPTGTIQTMEPALLVGAEKVIREGTRLGKMAVGFSLRRVDAARGRVALFVVVISLAVIAAIAASIVFATHVTRPIVEMTAIAAAIAEGDLSQRRDIKRSSADEVGAMWVAFSRMTTTWRQLVAHVGDTSGKIDATASTILNTSQRQAQGAAEQSNSVEETRRTMKSLLDAGISITDASDVVLRNAEATHANSRHVAESINTLSTHTDRITEILELIKDIANKSELLALNAALEGTKVGESGRGVSLVASQMQGLAESVMASVRDIKGLTEDIRTATKQTVAANGAAISLAADTTSSARDISLHAQQQQAAIEQVIRAMDDVSSIAQETTVGVQDMFSASHELSRLSQRMLHLVTGFRV